MKKFYCVRCLILFLTVFFSIGCSSDDAAPDPELTISTEQLVFSKDGDMKFFHVKSNASWAVSSSETWLTLSPASGEAGTIKVEATVVKNETPSVRNATITISAGSLSKQIAISQSESTILTVSSNEFTLDAEGEDITIPVTSSGEYTVTIEGDWITKVQGNPAKFKIDTNRGLLSRSGTIEFTLNDVIQTVTINQSGNPLNIPADNTGMSTSIMQLSQNMKVGWNIGNTMEATGVTNGVYTASETLWGNPKITKTLIDGVKAAGFNTIRIPCAWSGYIEDPVTYRIKDSWLARVKEVVDYCVANEMYVIVNIHWDGGWLEEHPLFANQVEVNKKQKALWQQIAVYFRDYNEHLLFAGTNEVHANYGNPTSENIQVQESYNQTFVNAVRATGGRNTWRSLIVQAYNTNITHAKDYMTMPADAAGITNRLMAEVHFYDPFDFTLDATSGKYLWGADYAGNANASNWGQEAWVDEAFGIVKTKFVDNGIPVILGEYGPMLRSSLPNGLADHIKARNHYLHYVTNAAKENGLVPVYWDNGGTGNNSSGLFNRATGEKVHTDAITAITSVFN